MKKHPNRFLVTRMAVFFPQPDLSDCDSLDQVNEKLSRIGLVKKESNASRNTFSLFLAMKDGSRLVVIDLERMRQPFPKQTPDANQEHAL